MTPAQLLGGLAPAVGGAGALKTHGLEEMRAAAREGYELRRAGHGKTMRLRQLYLGDVRTRSKNGVRKRRPSAAEARLSASIGAIFGATLKSVLEFAGVPPTKADSVRALRCLTRFFEPAADAMASVSGADRQHLANGLAAHRVASKQRRMLPECAEPQAARSYLGRNSLKDVAFGATAAVLVAHYVMSERGVDAAAVAESLQRATAHVDELLRQWPVGGSSSGDALRAEARAMARVRAAAVAAASLAAAQQLPRGEALRLQFEWIKAAAWPRGAVCCLETHEALCEQLRSGARDGCDGAPMQPPLLAMPLGALPSEAWLASGGGSDSSCSGSSCSGSSGSSGSLASSAGSVIGEEEAARMAAVCRAMCV